MRVLHRARSPLDEHAAERRFRQLFQAESRALIGYALRRVQRPEDAADVVADTFLVAWRRIDDVPAGAEGRLWLFGVARRVVANHHRGASRGHKLSQRLGEELARQAPVQDDGDGLAEAVRGALARLWPDDRELLCLVSWEGLRASEVARVLDLPAATVRTRLHRARRRLRAELGAEDLGAAPSDHPEPALLMPIPKDA